MAEVTEIVIRRRVSLGFLGDDYQESYLILKAIPVQDFDTVDKEAKAAADQKKSFEYIQNKIKSSFIEGKLQQGGKMIDLSVDDLGALPIDAFIQAYERITGSPDPKS